MFELEYSVLADPNIQLIIYLKLHELKREKLPSLRYSHIVDYLRLLKWRKKGPVSFNQATNDIMSIQADQVVSFLANQAIIEASRQHLDDYNDLMR